MDAFSQHPGNVDERLQGRLFAHHQAYLGDALGVVAHPFQFLGNMHDGYQTAQVAGHGLVGCNQVDGPLFQQFTLTVNQVVFAYHLGGGLQVTALQRVHRLGKGLVHHDAQGQQVGGEPVQTGGKVCPHHIGASSHCRAAIPVRGMPTVAASDCVGHRALWFPTAFGAVMVVCPWKRAVYQETYHNHRARSGVGKRQLPEKGVIQGAAVEVQDHAEDFLDARGLDFGQSAGAMASSMPATSAAATACSVPKRSMSRLKALEELRSEVCWEMMVKTISWAASSRGSSSKGP